MLVLLSGFKRLLDIIAFRVGNKPRVLSAFMPGFGFGLQPYEPHLATIIRVQALKQNASSKLLLPVTETREVSQQTSKRRVVGGLTVIHGVHAVSIYKRK